MELRRWLFCLFLSLPVTQAISAPVPKEKCESLDYSRRLGPVREQVGTEWCWAMTAADLIGFQQGITPDKQVAVIDVALAGLNMNEQRLMLAGAATGSLPTYMLAREEAEGLTHNFQRKRGLRLVRRQGWSLVGTLAYNGRERVCLESELPSQPATPFRVDKKPRPLLPELPDPLRRSQRRTTDQEFIEMQLKQLGDNSADFSSLSSWQRLAQSCVNEGVPEFLAYSTILEELNQVILASVDKEAQSRCKRGPSVRPMKGEVADFQRGEKSLASEKTAEWLRDGAPIGISLPTEFLEPGWKDSRNIKKWHETVLAGMRWNEETGSCDFKLRNSYGTDCSEYRDELKPRCEGGNIWLTEAELNGTARFATRIQLTGR